MSALTYTTDGFCTRNFSHEPGRNPKIRYPTSEDAAMALVDIRDQYVGRGGNVPIAWHACQYCNGFHLTSHPWEETIRREKPTGPRSALASAE